MTVYKVTKLIAFAGVYLVFGWVLGYGNPGNWLYISHMNILLEEAS